MKNFPAFLRTLPKDRVRASHAVFSDGQDVSDLLAQAYDAGYEDAAKAFRDWKIEKFEKILGSVVLPPPKKPWWKRFLGSP